MTMHPSQPDPASLFRQMVSEGDVVVDQLKAHAIAAPDRIFLYYGEEDRSISYGEFFNEASRLATAFNQLGVEPGLRIAVFTRNSYVAALVMFASWMAGAAYCPINFLYRGKLLAYQLHDTAPFLLVSDLNQAAALAEVNDQLPSKLVLHVPLSGDHDFVADAVLGPALATSHRLSDLLAVTKEDVSVPRNFKDTASIIYTSGTTGLSKGVVQPFRWINQYTFIYRKFFDASDVIYCDLPLYHVGGAFFRIAKAAYVGASVALYDRFSPGEFWNRIHRTRATHVTLLDVMTPWLMSAEPSQKDHENSIVKAHMQPLPLNHHAVAQRFGIDFVTAGFGQTESGSSFLSLIDQFPGTSGTPTHLWKGPSKDELISTANRYGVMVVRGDRPLAKGFIGTKSPLFDAAILDDDDEMCPPGVVGQLALRPRFPNMVLSEYFNKPEATIKASANFWFHTGDAARQESDGAYYFVDRMGGFFRVRGENVSSYQVEDLLNDHPKIQASAAIPVPAREGDEEECAVFVQLVDGEQMDVEELLAHARRVMPKYMIPAHVRFVPALPVTPTNKVEKYKLKQTLLAEPGMSA